VKARLEAQEALTAARDKKRKGLFGVASLGSRAAKTTAKRKKGWFGKQASSKSFEELDRNGDGIVTKDEYRIHEEEEPEQKNEKEREPPPTPKPKTAQVDEGQSAKAWEFRAKDWEPACPASDRARLQESLETIKQEKAEDVLARLPTECSGKALSAEGYVHYEELVPCMQALTNTSWKCSACPVSFMISMAANCRAKCASLAKGCHGRDACREQGAECLECAQPAALKLLRCAGGSAEMERHLAGVRLSEKRTEVFDGALAQLSGGSQVLWKVQGQALAAQRLITAWGIDPAGLDALAGPLLEALGVQAEEVGAQDTGGAGSALIAEQDVAKYDADGSGSLDGEELEHALAGMAAGAETLLSPKEAAKKAKEDARKKAEEERKEQEQERLALEAKRQAEEEEAARKAEEEVKRLEEEAARKKEEDARKAVEEQEAKRKAEEDARLQAEEDARIQAEEEEQRKLEEEAKKRNEEAEAFSKAIEDAKKKKEEDEKRAAEEEKRKIQADPKLKAQEDEWQKALEEEQAVQKKAEEEAAKRKAEEEAEAKRKADKEAKRKAEEDAKKAAEEAAARQTTPAPPAAADVAIASDEEVS